MWRTVLSGGDADLSQVREELGSVCDSWIHMFGMWFYGGPCRPSNYDLLSGLQAFFNILTS